VRSRGLLPFPRSSLLLLVGFTLWSILAASTLAYLMTGALATLLLLGSTVPCSGLLVRFQRRRPASETTVELTFDDGPDPDLTPAILDLLREEGVPATFFLVGRKVRANPALARRIVDEGHGAANHSWDHRPWHNFLTGAALRGNLSRACDAIEEICDIRPRLYRPPYGLVNPWTRAVVDGLGLRVVGWNVRGLDYGNRRVQGMAGRVLRRVSPGAIILLHDALPPGASAEAVLAEMRSLLSGLREKDLLLSTEPDQSSPVRQKS
jgi:peptidoglycan-N-acetylglucosamine deacetylase